MHLEVEQLTLLVDLSDVQLGLVNLVRGMLLLQDALIGTSERVGQLEVCLAGHVHNDVVLIDEAVVVGQHGNGQHRAGGVGPHIIIIRHGEEALPASLQVQLLEHEARAGEDTLVISLPIHRLLVCIFGLRDLDDHILERVQCLGDVEGAKL